jgi:hypothetical protein
MTKDEIIQMAKKANIHIYPDWVNGIPVETIQSLVQLVAKRCADIAETAEPYQSADLIRKHFGVEK